jgi:hypothetical protein
MDGREVELILKMHACSPVIKLFIVTFVILLLFKQAINEKFKLDH